MQQLTRGQWTSVGHAQVGNPVPVASVGYCFCDASLTNFPLNTLMTHRCDTLTSESQIPHDNHDKSSRNFPQGEPLSAHWKPGIVHHHVEPPHLALIQLILNDRRLGCCVVTRHFQLNQWRSVQLQLVCSFLLLEAGRYDLLWDSSHSAQLHL